MSGGDRAVARAWWTGGLFMVGSACFALGSFPAYFEHVAPIVTAWTFFVGSLCFTSAGFLQWRDASRGAGGERTVDWWAATVQLVGTLCFNISTFAATRADLDFDEEKRLIWAPDVYGSIFFLVASALAYSVLNPGVRPRSDGSVGWTINALNLLGSIAFGAAAVAARLVDTDGQVANIRLVNAGTFVGAVCFFVGAALLPALARAEPQPA